jgi:hypothetical protein
MVAVGHELPTDPASLPPRPLGSIEAQSHLVPPSTPSSSVDGALPMHGATPYVGWRRLADGASDAWPSAG